MPFSGKNTFMNTADRDYLLSLAVDAYLWGATLVQTGKFQRLADSRDMPMNTIINGPEIMSWAYAPCIDVLYSYAFLDLSKEPLVLAVPDMAGRQYTFQFMDTFGNVFGYIGTHSTGSKAGHYAIVAPGWESKLPAGLKRFDCPTKWLMVYVRTFVADEHDVKAANDACARYAIGPLSAYPDGLKPAIRTDVPLNEIFPILRFDHLGAKYFDVLGDRLMHRLPLEERNAVRKYAPIGVGPGLHPTKSGDSALVELLGDAVKIAQRRIDDSDFWSRISGWEVIENITAHQKDAQVRAYANRFGGGFHHSEECLYFHCRAGHDGKTLNGSKSYVLEFTAGELPPVDAFWSLAIMDLKMIPIRNPINRFAIAPHTKGLRYASDGSLRIYIQASQPAEGPNNWLPSGDGDFFITLRLYMPGQKALDGKWRPPQLQQK